MLFNSYIFILFFLPVSLILYYGFHRMGKEKAAQLTLIGMSLWFYAYFQWNYLLILIGSVLFNYGFARLMLKESLQKLRKILLVTGIIANAAVIFYFKYFNFFMDNINAVFGRSAVGLNILMPLGISFFTFQQISYLVDSYRGETKDYTFLEYMLFVVFFPQLIAGPIVLHDEMIPQFREPERRRLNQEKLAKGLWWFAIGLAKKVLIADTLGGGVSWGYANVTSLGALDTLVVSLLYCLQLYFDFSGYCDMASGIAAMFGFELPLNFNSPYKSLSIEEFWQRWHISLGRFLRKYVYFPLGGSRKGKLRTLRNVFVVFLVSGIWHGANWTYILWGVCHGIANMLNKLFGRIWEKLPKVLRWGMTFLAVDMLWIMFRADSLSQAWQMYGNLLKPWTLRLSEGLMQQFEVIEFTYIVEHVSVLTDFVNAFPATYLVVLLGLSLFIALVPKNCHEKEFTPTGGRAVYTVLLMVWSIVSLSGLSTFLYFNF